MTFLPIVERELRVRSRQAATWRGRWIPAGAVLLTALMILQTGGRGRTPSQAVSSLFSAVSLIAFVLCLIEGARQTSDCLSEEKRSGTLGLLFLTDLKGHDLVFGKLAATSLNSIYALLAMLPVLGLGLLAGGVTGGEFLRMTLVLLNTLFFALAAGLFVSARSHDAQKAFVATLALIFIVGGGAPVAEWYLSQGRFVPASATISLFSPAYGCYMVFDANYSTCPALFWLSLALTHLAAWSLLGGASLALVRHWQVPATPSERLNRFLPRLSHDTAVNRATHILKAGRRTQRRHRLLDRNPVLWLLCRKPGTQALLWSLMGVVLSLQYLPMVALGAGPLSSFRFYAPIYYYIALSLRYAVRFLVAWVACRFLAEARRSGAMELLLTTPLRLHEMVTGQWLALRRQFLWPVAWTMGAHLVITFYLVGSQHLSSQARPLASAAIFYSLLSALTIGVEIAALGFVGMWFALSLKKPAQAALRSFLLVSVAPILFCLSQPLAFATGMGGLFYIIGGLGNPLVTLLFDLWLIRWARGNLEKEYRRLSGSRIGTSGEFAG